MPAELVSSRAQLRAGGRAHDGVQLAGGLLERPERPGRLGAAQLLAGLLGDLDPVANIEPSSPASAPLPR